MKLIAEPKTIIITGASSGLGAALAIEYSVPGVKLFLSGRDTERLNLTCSNCIKLGAEVIAKNIDVVNARAVREWIEEIASNHIIDLIIANAGISGGTSGENESEEQIRKIFAVNIDGVINTIIPAIPFMSKHQQGQIVIISSLAAYRGLPSCPAYSASKAAVKIYGEGLRGLLHKHQVGVTVVTPGYIETPMTEVNNFPMPFLMKADQAARLIKMKLLNNPARISFPKILYLIIWLLSCLPPGITDPLFRNLPAKPKAL